MVLVWLVLGGALIWFELHHRAFYALFVAIGCLAAAVVAGIAPESYGVQVFVCLAVAAIGVFLLRPFVSKRFEAHHGGQVALGVHGGLIGQEALTLDVVGDIHQVGHARLAGERWLAVSGNGIPIQPDTTVQVLAVSGTTLTVIPLTNPPSLDAPDRAGMSPE